jgi:hypothetical protein
MDASFMPILEKALDKELVLPPDRLKVLKNSSDFFLK